MLNQSISKLQEPFNTLLSWQKFLIFTDSFSTNPVPIENQESIKESSSLPEFPWSERWLNGTITIPILDLIGDEYFTLLTKYQAYSKKYKFKQYNTMPLSIYLTPESI
jgi:hypothetical protein